MIALLGRAAAPAPVLFDPAAGEVVAADRRVALTPGEAAVLGALERAGGGCLSAAELSRRIHGDRDVFGEKIVHVLILRLRRKLAGLPATIETRLGFGYRLRVAAPG